MNHILTTVGLSTVVDALKKHKKRIVLVGGCFDILHGGHIAFLEAAKQLGDILIVLLEHDKNVARLKGALRPFQTQKERAYILSSLRFVDYVVCLVPMDTEEEYNKLITAIGPLHIAVTSGDSHLERKRRHAQKVGASIHIIPKEQTRSTSELAKRIGLE